MPLTPPGSMEDLFGTFLGQDWPDDYGSPKAAFLAFLECQSPPVSAVRDQLAALSTAEPMQLAALIESWRCAYRPENGDYNALVRDMLSWLSEHPSGER